MGTEKSDETTWFPEGLNARSAPACVRSIATGRAAGVREERQPHTDEGRLISKGEPRGHSSTESATQHRLPALSEAELPVELGEALLLLPALPPPHRVTAKNAESRLGIKKSACSSDSTDVGPTPICERNETMHYGYGYDSATHTYGYGHWVHDSFGWRRV